MPDRVTHTIHITRRMSEVSWNVPTIDARDLSVAEATELSSWAEWEWAEAVREGRSPTSLARTFTREGMNCNLAARSSGGAYR